MDLLDLPQLADRTGLPLSLTRYYRDRFILFVPSVRIGRTILHPVEAVDVLTTIRDHAATGLSVDAIQAALEQCYPVTVISSQDVPGDETAGAFGAVRALAAAIDERGARVEAEVAKLREQVAATSSANQLQAALADSKEAQATVAADHAQELQRIRTTIDELRAHISLLASRDQLEWIGDVVAAAALRPPQGAMDAAIERRLQGIDEQIQELRESREMDAMRESIERLAVRSGGRDQEIHRAFQMLIGAVRKEIAAVHQRLAELKLAVNAGEPILLVEEHVRAAAPNGHHIAAGIESNGARRHEDRHKPRPPRRLGQPLRGIGSPVGPDEAVSAD